MTNVTTIGAARSTRAQRISPGDYLEPGEIETIRAWLQEPGIDDIELSNAVARICLNPVQSRLPQTGVATKGQFGVSREYDERRSVVVELAPQHLLKWNWADTAPGLSWTETYYATFLPGFNRWIVTMSVDSDDLWGVTDLALGAFGKRSDLVRSSGRLIVRHWREHHCYDDEAEGCSRVLRAGLVDRKTAIRWRERVWPRSTDT